MAPTSQARKPLTIPERFNATGSLYLEGLNRVSDLSPLKGMPLTYLDLSGLKDITDLSPLKGKPGLSIFETSDERRRTLK